MSVALAACRPYLNVLMVFVVLAVVCDAKKWSSSILFTFSILGIVPFAERLGWVTDQLTLHTNDTRKAPVRVPFRHTT